MTRAEKLARNTSVISLAVVAAMGTTLLRPRSVSAACDTVGQIARLKTEIDRGQSFRQSVLEPAHYRDGSYVKVFSKRHAGSEQFTIDPVVIKCGEQAVRYVGLTNDPHLTLGRRYDTGKRDKSGEVYMDVVDPADTVTEADIGIGPAQDRLIVPSATLHFKDIYDRDLQSYYPALVGPHPGLPVSRDAQYDIFGEMPNSYVVEES